MFFAPLWDKKLKILKSICFKYLVLFTFLAIVQLSFAQSRRVIDFDDDWKFFLGDDSAAIDPAFDDSKWRSVNLPHDWSIESDFTKDYPATNQGGALPGGIGWYRKTFVLPTSAAGKNVRIEFDGVYRNSEVWINGQYLGKWAYGYTAFDYDLTKYLQPAPAENIITVKVDNSQQPNSRWYTGSGIYRNVQLILSNKDIAIAHHSVFITTRQISDNKAQIYISAKLDLNADSIPGTVRIAVDIYDSKERQVYEQLEWVRIKGMFTGDPNQFEDSIIITNPKFWSPDQPNLYKAVINVSMIDQRDEFSATFGIRSFRFDDKKGFFINDKPLKIKGVCLHHDLGALGAAFNKVAARRQLKVLKEMGCNAIRTAHNPPAAEFLDLCDEMGFLVMDEAFDIWQKRKNKFDYHQDFKDYHEQDLKAMILRDRNHPSVFMWSIGNEIREQFDSTGIALTRELTAIVKSLDTTRPVICALTENFPEKNFIYQSGVLDVLGFNYKLDDYKDLPTRFPGQKILAAETVSALATRGVYDQPSDSMRIWPPDSKQPFTKGNADMTVSAYDNTYAYWGATHEKAWLAVKNNEFMAGCFVWSGFDFLGEPVPYPWPARSSYYGIIDLAGFPKDVYYMYQSEWTTKPVLHIFPHWNWSVGKTVDVWAYYNNADEVELYLNGRSLGKRKKTKDKLHVIWQVPYSPGTLKAISRKNGKTVLIKEIKTAGKPVRIELKSERKMIMTDGKDLAFVTVRVVDKDGNLVPNADNLIKFRVEGAGFIAGTDNGFQADTMSLKNTNRKAWKGMALVIIQSNGKKGNITLRADSAGLLSQVFTLKTTD